jgi:hypothetical protein
MTRFMWEMFYFAMAAVILIIGMLVGAHKQREFDESVCDPCPNVVEIVCRQ